MGAPEGRAQKQEPTAQKSCRRYQLRALRKDWVFAAARRVVRKGGFVIISFRKLFNFH